MLTVNASMLYLQCIILSDTCCGKNAEAAAENGHLSTLARFFKALSHTQFALAAHLKPIQSRLQSSFAWVCVSSAFLLAFPWQKLFHGVMKFFMKFHETFFHEKQNPSNVHEIS
jgi:hypothetical protein